MPVHLTLTDLLAEIKVESALMAVCNADATAELDE